MRVLLGAGQSLDNDARRSRGHELHSDRALSSATQEVSLHLDHHLDCRLSTSHGQVYDGRPTLPAVSAVLVAHCVHQSRTFAATARSALPFTRTHADRRRPRLQNDVVPHIPFRMMSGISKETGLHVYTYVGRL